MNRTTTAFPLARRLGVAVVWLFALLLAAIVIGIAGVRITGSVEDWQRVASDHNVAFFVWRLLLYSATVSGWLWMRRRVHARDPSPTSRRQLVRAEVAALLTLIVLEIHLAVREG